MSGKAILVLAIGFSALFLMFGRGFFDVSYEASVDLEKNINEEKALEIARSATNVAISYFWQYPKKLKLTGGTQSFYENKDFEGGKVSTQLVKINKDNIKIITKAAYGEGENIAKKMVVVLYGPEKLTKMASFSYRSGNIWWTGSDSVKGAIYCGQQIPVYNHPTFLSDVYSASSDFKYYGGRKHKADHMPNVDPNNLHFRTPLRRASGVMNGLRKKARENGWYLRGSRWNDPSQDTMYIKLNGNKMEVKFSKNETPVVYDIASKAPNGVVFADNYVFRVQGKLDGQLLLACHGNIKKGKGKIFIDDDLTYQDDPRTTSKSDDMLGLVANDDVIIADTPPNQHDIDIQAAIYSQNGGLTAENATTKPDAGIIDFYGSLIEKERQPVGKFDPDTGQLWGYGRNYEYDKRMEKMSPPSFPKLAGFNVLAWYEGDVPESDN